MLTLARFLYVKNRTIPNVGMTMSAVMTVNGWERGWQAATAALNANKLPYRKSFAYCCNRLL